MPYKLRTRAPRIKRAIGLRIALSILNDFINFSFRQLEKFLIKSAILDAWYYSRVKELEGRGGSLGQAR